MEKFKLMQERKDVRMPEIDCFNWQSKYPALQIVSIDRANMHCKAWIEHWWLFYFKPGWQTCHLQHFCLTGSSFMYCCRATCIRLCRPSCSATPGGCCTVILNLRICSLTTKESSRLLILVLPVPLAYLLGFTHMRWVLVRCNSCRILI